MLPLKKARLDDTRRRFMTHFAGIGLGATQDAAGFDLQKPATLDAAGA